MIQDNEISPHPDHFNDPYVLQLIEALAKATDEIEKLTNRWNAAQKCLNEIDDFMEYIALRLSPSEIQARVHRSLAEYTLEVSGTIPDTDTNPSESIGETEIDRFKLTKDNQ